jgi:hypothetical protein
MPWLKSFTLVAIPYPKQVCRQLLTNSSISIRIPSSVRWARGTVRLHTPHRQMLPVLPPVMARIGTRLLQQNLSTITLGGGKRHWRKIKASVCSATTPLTTLTTKVAIVPFSKSFELKSRSVRRQTITRLCLVRPKMLQCQHQLPPPSDNTTSFDSLPGQLLASTEVDAYSSGNEYDHEGK